MRIEQLKARGRGFTLIELLIVIAIIAILATVLLTALSGAKKRTQIAVAKSQITALKAALANYKSDMGRYPRRAIRPTGTANPGDGGWYDDDCIALYAALRNKPTLEVGGGQNSPYVDDWKPEYIGYFSSGGTSGEPSENAANAMGSNGVSGPYVERVPETDHGNLLTLAYQKTHKPGSGGSQQLIFLDPWGAPYHYREWASVRSNLKDFLITNPIGRSCTADPNAEGAVIQNPQDRPHNPEGFDIWSNGPNGVNEYGDPESDDVCSWRE
ncbi:MAG: prepilin-type N-terminal cleavage/methylation domain-containing protein [Planctomycetota bacterium]